MSRSSAARKAAPTLESLAEQLRDGPLKCLTALQDHAEALADQQPTGNRELLEHLQSIDAQLIAFAFAGVVLGEAPGLLETSATENPVELL